MLLFIKIQKFQLVRNLVGIRFDKSHAGETLQNEVDFLQKKRGCTGKNEAKNFMIVPSIDG